VRRKFRAMINASSHRIRWKYRWDTAAAAAAVVEKRRGEQYYMGRYTMVRVYRYMRFDLLYYALSSRSSRKSDAFRLRYNFISACT